MLDFLPSKHVHLHETIVGLGAVVLAQLQEARDLDSLWEALKELKRRKRLVPDHTTLEDLIFSVDLLHALGAVEVNERGELVRCA